MEKIPLSPEKQKEILDDNARKFAVDPLSADLLKEYGAVSYTLVTDWLEMGASSEKKVVVKKYDNGNIQRFLITKVTESDSRKSEKEEITEEEYAELASRTSVHVEKRRYEFNYEQFGTVFSVKYDEFIDSKLCVLEVDASSDELRQSFKPFVGNSREVTGDLRYYGYRVAGQI